MAGWIKFDENSKLTNDRVSIAYDTHDDRGIRYAYGYFQFVGGKCICFWKDGHHLSRTVKVEDIRYWMPIPAFDAVEECSEDEENVDSELFEAEWKRYINSKGGGTVTVNIKDLAKHFVEWEKQRMIDKFNEWCQDEFMVHPHDSNVVQYVSEKPYEDIDDFVEEFIRKME